MAFICLSALPPSAKTAARTVGEGAAAAAACAGAAGLWRGPAEHGAIFLGAGAAWLASSASVVWLIWARPSPKAFWRAFGGGLALRVAVLLGLMVLCLHDPRRPAPALLLSYAFGVLCLLMIECRHIKA